MHRLVGSLLMIHAAEANLYAGLTWEQISQATAMTGQAAWQKWRYAPGTQDPIGTIRRSPSKSVPVLQAPTRASSHAATKAEVWWPSRWQSRGFEGRF